MGLVLLRLLSCLSLFIFLAFFVSLIHFDVIEARISKFMFPRPLYQEQITPLKEGLSYQTLYYEQQVDHFGFANLDTYKQRYLLSDQFWNGNGGPIFFYTGNEGDIEWFCNNTGFMWDIAPEFSAMIVFAEHRYYGKSMPYGPDPYKNVTLLNFLTAEQALADFAVLIRHIKDTVPGAANSPVVAFGGSYGGMLAAWFRIKYPNVVVGSLASSAPVWQFTGILPCYSINDVIGNTFKKASPACFHNVRRGFDTLEEMASKTGGYKFISQTFGLCKSLKSKDDLAAFKSFLAGTYYNLALVDYPYPANFMANLPGWPVKKACKFLGHPLKEKPLIEGLAKVTNLYYNYTGDAKCIKWTGSDQPSLGYEGWNYQACTEMVMPSCSNGSGMFYKMPWDFQAFSDYCYKEYKLRPRRDWITLQYWGTALKAASNIIFSNGLLDPCSGGGILQSISDTIVAIQIPEGAHHYDLRGRNPKDTSYVIEARLQEVNIIRNWLHNTPSS